MKPKLHLFFHKTKQEGGVWFDHTRKSSMRFTVDSPNWGVGFRGIGQPLESMGKGIRIGTISSEN